ncbi:MAG TPA: type II secretion system protein GspE, partial [Bryobacteraceae bacterium]|nr:type II secretion system protein GspE [Bryobacteraceae bacterium]
MAATIPPIPDEAPTAPPDAPVSREYRRLGEILIAAKKIEEDELDRALELQLERGDKLGKILVDMGLIAQRDVLAALSAQMEVPLVTVDGPPPSAPEIEGLSHRFLRQCRAYPIG